LTVSLPTIANGHVRVNVILRRSMKCDGSIGRGNGFVRVFLMLCLSGFARHSAVPSAPGGGRIPGHYCELLRGSRICRTPQPKRGRGKRRD